MFSLTALLAIVLLRAISLHYVALATQVLTVPRHRLVIAALGKTAVARPLIGRASGPASPRSRTLRASSLTKL